MSSYDPHGVRLRDADRVFLEDRPHRVYLCALTAQEQPGMCSARGCEVSAQSAAMSMKHFHRPAPRSTRTMDWRCSARGV